MRQETRVRLALASGETMGSPTRLVRANEVVGEEMATGRRYGLLVVSCFKFFPFGHLLGNYPKFINCLLNRSELVEGVRSQPRPHPCQPSRLDCCGWQT